MCIFSGHMGIFVQNMKLLYLILCLGHVCTDANADAKANGDNDGDANNNTRRAKHDCIRLLKNQMSQKVNHEYTILKLNNSLSSFTQNGMSFKKMSPCM